MNRYYLPPSDWIEGVLRLSGDEAKHCAQVMREPIGGQIEIFDGAGTSAVCQITRSSRSEVDLQLVEKQYSPKPARQVVLVQSVPKGKNMDWIVQKAVELGVSRIIPILTQHCIFKVSSPADAVKKQEKWQRIALEASKQCGQNWIVQIDTPQKLDKALVNNDLIGLVGSLQKTSQPLKKVLLELPDDGEIAIAVGPEGDFSPEEYDQFYRSGFSPVSLGPLVLRVETATLVMLSALVVF